MSIGLSCGSLTSRLAYHVEEEFIFVIQRHADPFLHLDEKSIGMEDKSRGVNFTVFIVNTHDSCFGLSEKYIGQRDEIKEAD